MHYCAGTDEPHRPPLTKPNLLINAPALNPGVVGRVNEAGERELRDDVGCGALSAGLAVLTESHAIYMW